MLPLNKLRKFARNAPTAPAAPAPETAPVPQQPSLPPAPPLSQAELCAMANPRSHSCEHCKVKASEVTTVAYTETPTFKLWLCMPCTAHYYKTRVLPPIVPPRALPVLLRRKV